MCFTGGRRQQHIKATLPLQLKGFVDLVENGKTSTFADSENERPELEVRQSKVLEPPPKPPDRRNVSFGTVHVRLYERIRTDNEARSTGSSAGIGWQFVEQKPVPLADWEKLNKTQRKKGLLFSHSPMERWCSAPKPKSSKHFRDLPVGQNFSGSRKDKWIVAGASSCRWQAEDSHESKMFLSPPTFPPPPNNRWSNRWEDAKAAIPPTFRKPFKGKSVCALPCKPVRRTSIDMSMQRILVAQ